VIETDDCSGWQTLVFVSWPKLPVLMVLCGEYYCSDAKTACPVEGLVVIDGPAIVNSPNYEVQCMVIVRSELMIDKLFDLK
jgi:hypothetical protein